MDEQELLDIANKYFDALAARDAERLPLAHDVRFTENTAEIDLGEGLWATITGLKPYRHLIPDPQSQQIGFFAAVAEGDAGDLLAGRLKIAEGKITEIETIVVRPSTMGAFLSTDQAEIQAGFKEMVPQAQRKPRAELIRIANSYFDGLVQGTGEIVPFAENCRRFENGMQTAGERPPPAPNAVTGPSMPPMRATNGKEFKMPTDAKAQFNTRFFTYITRIAPRRFEVVDEGCGVVLAFAMFHHRGDVREVDVPGVGTVPMIAAALRPFSVIIAEAFAIRDGLIHEIEAFMTSLPYGSKTGWEK
jgi:hypothetical protein